MNHKSEVLRRQIPGESFRLAKLYQCELFMYLSDFVQFVRIFYIFPMGRTSTHSNAINHVNYLTFLFESDFDSDCIERNWPHSSAFYMEVAFKTYALVRFIFFFNV